MVTVKATILFDGSLWLGIFERSDKKGFAIARQMFEGEPSDKEIYSFILKNYDELKFGLPEPFQLVIERENPPKSQETLPPKKKKRKRRKNV